MIRALTLVTSNPNKAAEAARLLSIPVAHVSIHLEEIQSSTLEEIASAKLVTARALVEGPLLVEDVSLGFDELGGFPGPYIRWLMESAGGAGLGAIARGLKRKTARASCCLVYWDGAASHVFTGSVDGEILVEPRGPAKFGWNPWFVPDGSTETLAEMSAAEKDSVSHRARAYAALQAHLETETSGLTR